MGVVPDAGRERELVDELLHRPGVADDRDMGAAPGGGQGDLWRNVGVAVPIAADPAPRPNRHDGPRILTEHVGEGATDAAHGGHHRVGKAVLEVPQGVARLVQHRGAVLADLGGEPQELHLGLQVPAEGGS